MVKGMAKLEEENLATGDRCSGVKKAKATYVGRGTLKITKKKNKRWGANKQRKRFGKFPEP